MIETEETEEKDTLQLVEKESQYLLDVISSLCNTYFSSLNLPDDMKIEKNANYYMTEIINLLRKYNLVQ